MKKGILAKKILLSALVAGSFVLSANPVLAAGAGGEFTLDPIIVTASRYAQKDLDIPATTEVMDRKQLVNTGASTLREALRFTTGIVYKANTVGDDGGEFLIRGKRRGTLVMVNGVPLNVRNGYYNLDNIAVQDVERVEIVRGGGAVLYGSDTTGGVINIITKKELSNTASVEVGNYGRQTYSATMQEGKVGFGIVHEEKGKVDKVSAPSGKTPTLSSKYFDYKGGHKNIFSLNYNFDDAWRLTSDVAAYNYEREYNWALKDTPCIADHRDINNDEMKLVLNYEKHGWTGNAHYHNKKSNTDYTYWNYPSATSSVTTGKLDKIYEARTTDATWGIDLMKEFKLDDDVLIVGAGAYKESYENSAKNKPKFKDSVFKKYYKDSFNKFSRNVYSAFVSWNHAFDEKDNLVMSARETWTGSAPDGGDNKDEFTPQVQYLHKFSDDLSFYASAGKSFTLPTLKDLYGSSYTKGSSLIRPEVGKHYETGLKYVKDNQQIKLAVFKSDVKDFIRLGKNKAGEQVAFNEDTKNTGVELSYEIDGNNGWSSNLGVSVGNPKFKNMKDKNPQWKRSYGRVQVNGGVNYTDEKFSAALNGNYLYDRVLEKYQEKVKPLFITSLHLSYKPEADKEIYLDVDNLLDRKDITSHVLSRYYSLPANFMLGYKLHF